MRRKAYRITTAGSLNHLLLVDEELPPPSEDELTVQVRAIGLNFADVFTILGLYRAAPKENFVPGLEFSGTVAEVGSRVAGFRIGDRVMGSIRFGSYATHLNIGSSYVIRIPDSWTYEEGASHIVQALTAYYAVVSLGNLKAGQTVLIHSAAGGVGIYANRIAKKLHTRTIGTVGSANKIERIKLEGYDDLIVRSKHFRDDLSEKLDGRKLDQVLDSIGGRIQKDSFDFLNTSGRMVAYGLSDFASPGIRPDYFRLLSRFISRPRYDTLSLIESNKSIMGFNLIWLYDKVDMLKEMLSEIESLNLGKPLIGEVFEFNSLKDAIRKFQSGRTIGKIVVRV